jgi:predicted enzyme related to lactoylglutathione lyase
MTKPDTIPSPFWGYYFNVSAIDAAAERVKAAGGAIMMGPHEVPGGQWILQCTDPQGACFALVASGH